VKSTQGGTLISNFQLATSEKYTDRNNNKVEKTEWHNIAAFARTAEIVRDYVAKGSLLYLEGKLETSSWDDKESGKKMYKTRSSSVASTSSRRARQVNRTAPQRIRRTTPSRPWTIRRFRSDRQQLQRGGHMIVAALLCFCSQFQSKGTKPPCTFSSPPQLSHLCSSPPPKSSPRCVAPTAATSKFEVIPPALSRPRARA